MRLNLGSGQRPFGEGWTNVDINPRWNPDIVADCSSMPMIKDGAVEMAVSHHNAEHYGCGEASGMVRECHRVLEPGGSLIVCVPNMSVLCRWWIEGRMDTQLFMTNVYGAFMDSDADRHRWGFDQNSLKAFLASAAPWSKIVPFNWRHIEGADIARAEWVLAMECMK